MDSKTLNKERIKDRKGLTRERMKDLGKVWTRKERFGQESIEKVLTKKGWRIGNIWSRKEEV